MTIKYFVTLGASALALLATAFAPAAEAPAALKTSLSSGAQGAIVSLAGLNAAYLAEPANLTRTWDGPKLMFSDSPESPSTSGNLYVDSFAANTPVRVFFYHANGASTNKKFNVVVRNMGTSTATVQRTKMALAGPTTNYVYGGKIAAQRYMQSTGGTSLSVAPNACVLVDSAMNAITASPTQLVHGIYDLTSNQPIKIYCLVTDPSTDATAVAPTLAVLSRDAHVRGTFPYADKVIDAPLFTDDGAFQIAMGDGTVDAAAVGVEAISGSAITLGGNYGVLYRFHFTTYADDSRNMGFLLNPRAGTLSSAVNCAAGITAGGVALVPSGTTNISANTDGAIVSKYTPTPAGIDVWTQWMPTGGSSVPAKLLIIPYE